ncbi:hypothetical protein [Streptomyces sp. NPDC047042]|uniref:hypothetical protein n=1 Tax=Streptomyces sp. NPDC047042 TaxID=3154807 RepID=UPI0033DF5BD3
MRNAGRPTRACRTRFPSKVETTGGPGTGRIARHARRAGRRLSVEDARAGPHGTRFPSNVETTGGPGTSRIARHGRRAERRLFA